MLDEYVVKFSWRHVLAGWFVIAPVFGRAQVASNVVLALHAQDLVQLHGTKLVPFNAETFLKAPYTILYFGAGWCPDCRRFSPALVAAYQHQLRSKERFEVLLLPRDKTMDGMIKFMRAEKMTWPAIAFDKVGTAPDLMKYYSGNGIPCLTVIDRAGKVLLQSRSDQDATEVLRQLLVLLKKKD